MKVFSETDIKIKCLWVMFLTFCEGFSVITAVPSLFESEVTVGQSTYCIAYIGLAIYFHLIAKEHRQEIKEYLRENKITLYEIFSKSSPKKELSDEEKREQKEKLQKVLGQVFPVILIIIFIIIIFVCSQ